MKYKVIALDIDGTLINTHQEIMPMTQKILIELQQKGIRVVLSSGRDLYSLEKIGKNINMSQYPQSGYIALNGLEIYDTQNNLLHKEKKLQREDAMILSRIANEYHLDMILFFYQELYIQEYGHTGIIDHHFTTTKKDINTKIQDIPITLFKDLRKVAFVQKKEVIQNILPLLHQEMDDNYEMTLVEEDWIEINPKGINKGNALKQYAKLNNILLEEIIAFGNGENDIEMLKSAGCGVAMANSFDNVKRIANDICGHCDEDGIGRYLLNCIK